MLHAEAFKLHLRFHRILMSRMGTSLKNCKMAGVFIGIHTGFGKITKGDHLDVS